MIQRYDSDGWDAEMLPKGEGDYVTYDDHVKALKEAEARVAELEAALKEAADRAVAYCRQFDGFFEGEDDLALRAAIEWRKE